MTKYRSLTQTFFSGVLTAALAATLAACSATHVARDGSRELPLEILAAGPDAATTAQQEADLVIISSTDFHATIDRAEAFTRGIRALKARHKDKALTVSAGDLFQGSIEGNESKGRAVIDVFNSAGIDVVAMGNHDIDPGPSRPGPSIPGPGEHPRGAMNDRVKQSQFPWLAANVAYKRGRAPKTAPFGASPTAKLKFRNALGRTTLFPPHIIRKINGLKVGIIGAITSDTPHITLPAFVADLEFLPLQKVIAAETEYLRREENCDAVILVAHTGLQCSGEHSSDKPAPFGSCREDSDRAEMYNLLMALPYRTLDAAVAGHTHLVANEVINGTPVIESGAYAKSLGVLYLKFNRGPGAKPELARTWFQHHTLEGDLDALFPEAPAPADLTAALKPYRDAAEKIKIRPVGKIKAPFMRDRMKENPLTNAVAASLLARSLKTPTPADAAIMNAGGVRADITSPDVLYGHVYKALPFDNALTVARLSGKDLETLVEIAVSGQHGVSGFANIFVEAYDVPLDKKGPWDRDLNGDGKKELWERDIVKSITVKGKPLDRHRDYRVATLDFLAQGGDHNRIVYGKLPLSRLRYYYELKGRDAFAGFVAAHSDGLDPAKFFNPPAKVQVRWIPSSEITDRN